MPRWLVVLLMAALTASIVISVSAQDSASTTVHVRVWQHTAAPERIFHQRPT